MKIRCLIIDRNPIFGEKLGRFIAGFRDNFRVQSVENVDDAIEAIIATDFSLVLCEPALADPATGLVSSIIEHRPAMPLIVTGQDDSPVLKKLASHSCVRGFIARPVVRTADLAGKVVIALGTLFLQGNVRGVNCITLFQIFEQECSECTLRVINTKEKGDGLLFVKNGVLLDAVCGDLAPEEAAKKVFSWEKVDIELYNFSPLQEKKVNVDMTALMLQCADKQCTDKPQSEKPPSHVQSNSSSPKRAAKPASGLAGLLLKKTKKK
jgi:hypothetical protein